MLDQLELYRDIDPEDMHHLIIHLPEQVYLAYREPKPHFPDGFVADPAAIKRIVVCGMGGSAISGDILRTAFQHLLPIVVVKDYVLPAVDESTLVVGLSYSGNTEETLSCITKALTLTPHLAAVTSGGQLRGLIDGRYPWLELPGGFPPRAAVGHLFFSLLKLLDMMGIIPDQTETVDRVIGHLMMKAGAVTNKAPESINLAKSSARAISGKIPIIYAGSPVFEPLAYRWKCQINENAKYPAFHHTFPEMNHNEIEGWEHPTFGSQFIPVFLTGFKEEQNYAKRIDAFKEILDETGIDSLIFYAEGESVIEQIFSLLYLGDIISFYLAVLGEVNPTAIRYIDRMKKRITK